MNLYSLFRAIAPISNPLFILPLLAFALMWPIPAQVSAQVPELRFVCPRGDYYTSLPDAAYRTGSRDSCPLVIEELRVWEMYPLLTYVFFDSGSATLPGRYILLSDPAQTAGFTDTTIPGGTLEQHYHLLNIIGYRMRMHPFTTIEVAGSNSEEPHIGEHLKVSAARANVVRNYLKDIWSIDPARIKVLPPRNSPSGTSRNDHLSWIESRRAEISSQDWEIMKPVVVSETQYYPQPEKAVFEMKNGIEIGLVKHRVIEIRRNGRLWHVMDDIGLKSETTEPPYNWGRNGNSDSLPTDETPYVAQLVVYDKSGGEHHSREIEIPVVIITHEEKMRERLVKTTMESFSLAFYKTGKPMLDELHLRILREFVYGRIGRGARIRVIGHTDVIGLEEVNKRVSALRAEAVGKRIKRDIPGVPLIETTGVGEDDPLYSNLLPEGRFNNRAVRIVVETPVGEVGDNETGRRDGRPGGRLEVEGRR